MCKHYGTVLPEDHRHYINSVLHDNCVLCLAEEKGPMTQEQIGKYLGVTKEWISQIEKNALRKLRSALGSTAFSELFNEPDPSFTPKSVFFYGHGNIAKYLDVYTKFTGDVPEDVPCTWKRKACIAPR